MGIAATNQLPALDPAMTERPATDSSPLPDFRYLARTKPETEWPILLFRPGHPIGYRKDHSGNCAK
jgi:hypothetical protein